MLEVYYPVPDTLKKIGPGMFYQKSVMEGVLKLFKYRNDPKFSDRYAWANSADPERSSLIRLITETSPYSFGNFRKLSLYNCFMPIYLIYSL